MAHRTGALLLSPYRTPKRIHPTLGCASAETQPHPLLLLHGAGQFLCRSRCRIQQNHLHLCQTSNTPYASTSPSLIFLLKYRQILRLCVVQ
ncbi:hypothetical protein RSOL_231580 [Rhizoctonia solani AG-3 Rhs1AP]|uniref:Uncharacterized protein n=2 Tax=Rhizoctonia solani AG-3 TaxID=1086053 RepID=A0A074SDS9_9AGAM|nr:hypothetical protein RSOL_231580 [Rhizoctonia solani AG-3 Rhs1AP]KEP48187.1 hypothetical protein V565_131500 [Rhizoctonia solani 123E]